ncbi:type II CAAX endopeptidase family protein [Danxiaibacter flavus]|uniref:Type II CAAX endopeptidase family protein n=1 Tax=Danxiaibacter flavus TaxID=3049108 RepID=A0ABV3ZK02_9BACT|nr:type II CAAX endopeptidase family protein [Chitinophagaceae bacterium DXS]
MKNLKLFNVEEPLHEIYHCDECKANVKGYQRFCHNCGAYLGNNAEEVSIFNNKNLRFAFLFYLINLCVCIFAKSSGWFFSYDHLFWLEIVLAIIAILFARLNRKTVLPALRFNNFNFFVLLAVIASAALFAFVVNICVHQLNISLFRNDVSYYSAYRAYNYPVLLMIYSIALMPALFEELAFRGVLYGYLGVFLDDRLVVILTGFAFATIHLNFISLVWLIPFGVVLGALRRRYDTIWYGVIFHFIFNLTACLMDLYKHGVI